jgi:ribonuclease HI
MAASKIKFYVVWKGWKTGVFDSWAECQKQVKGFSQANYMSFSTREMAERAFQGAKDDFRALKNVDGTLTEEQRILIGEPVLESISVDGAWNTITGVVEYKGVHTRTKDVIFHQGPFEDGTNNIVEFLAIVHALAHCKKKGLDLPVYSDSKNAINWVRDKEVRTSHPKSDGNAKLFEMMDRAIAWLKRNEYDNKILKWETRIWGENPADFGRK